MAAASKSASGTSTGHRFSSRELRDPLRATKRLLIAAQDMGDANTAAQILLAEHGPERPLETAVAVCYARPWTNSTIEKLGGRWLPSAAADLELHERLLRARAKVYAHTDEEMGARGIRDVGSMLGQPQSTFAVEWKPFNRDLLPAIVDLTERQQKRFKSAARELERRIDRYVVKVVWPPNGIAPAERAVFLDELEAEVFALVPHSERRPDERAVLVELEPRLADGTPLDHVPVYAVQRLLRAARQWWRQLRFPDIGLYLVLREHTYAIPANPPDQLNPAAIAADHASAPAGLRLWDPAMRAWAAKPLDRLASAPTGGASTMGESSVGDR